MSPGRHFANLADSQEAELTLLCIDNDPIPLAGTCIASSHVAGPKTSEIFM